MIRNNGQLPTYVDIADRLPALREMAKAIRMSEMIPGIKNEDMSFMVLMECEVTGQTLFEWSENNHIVGTRPTMKYDAMIAAYNSLPGCRCKLIEKTPEKVAIELKDGDSSQVFSLTWDELKNESVPYDGKESEVVALLAAKKEPKLKPKYATPRSRAIMMFARLVSDAIRSTRPEVTKGRYTPEEVEDFETIDAISVNEVPRIEPPLSETAAAVLEKVKAKKAAESKVEKKADDKAKPAKTVEAKAEPAKAVTSKVVEASADDSKTVDAVSVTEVAKESIEAKTAAADEDTATNTLVGKTEINLNEPATTEQVEKLKATLGELKRAGLDLVGAVKAKLTASGIVGLAGLTVGEARILQVKLDEKEISVWAETPIAGHASFQQ